MKFFTLVLGLFVTTLPIFTLGYMIVDDTVLKIDLSTHQLVVSVAEQNNAQSLQSLIRQVDGIAGINGAYFCPDEEHYTRCGRGNTTIVDRIVAGINDNPYGSDTGIRGIMGVTRDNTALFVQNHHGRNLTAQPYHNNTNSERYDEVYYGISNAPILLDQGKDVLAYYANFIDATMTTKARRNFICHTKDDRYIYMGSVPSMTIYDMPSYIRERYQCYNAINLDAGGSTALYANNRYILGPGRNIVDAFVIIDKQGNKYHGEELTRAITMLFELGITKFDEPISFMYDQSIRRDEAAAMIYRLGSKLNILGAVSDQQCIFLDINQGHRDLQDVIQSSCRYGLFQGYRNLFMPMNLITYGEFVTVITRLIHGKKDEPTDRHRASLYHDYLRSQGHLDGLRGYHPDSLDTAITRGDVAIILNRILGH